MTDEEFARIEQRANQPWGEILAAAQAPLYQTTYNAMLTLLQDREALVHEVRRQRAFVDDLQFRVDQLLYQRREAERMRAQTWGEWEKEHPHE